MDVLPPVDGIWPNVHRTCILGTEFIGENLKEIGKEITKIPVFLSHQNVQEIPM